MPTIFYLVLILHPTVKIYHQFMLASHVGHGPYFGWPIFELDTFSPLELAHLSVPNSLILCSEWAKNICERYQHNVQVVPLGYDPAIFFPHIDRQLKEKYIFFNCGKWETRKGHDILIKAFLDAFEVSDNVELWMMPTHPFLKEHETIRWETLYTKNKLWSKVKLLPRVRSHIEVADVMRYVDCGVFPARAEGWNLEALEMLACEKELVITDYSAHSMYAHDNNSHIINITQIETALGEGETERNWFHGQGNWGYFDKNAYDQLVHHMRSCYMNRPHKAVLDPTAKKFTWDNTAKELVKVLNNYED